MKLRHAIPYIALIAVAVIVFVAYQSWKMITTDSVPPVITVSAELLEISVNDPEDALLRGITARDDRDGDVTDSIVVEKKGDINDRHEIQVTYAAFDRSGNVRKIRRTVHYTDYRSPRFSLKSPLTFLYGRDVDITSNVRADDLIDGDISHKIKPTLVSEVPVSSEGIHQMHFRVTNSLGDTSVVQMPVEIYPTGKYNSTLTLTDYIVYIPQGGRFIASDYLDEFKYDTDKSISLRRSVPDYLRLQISRSIDTTICGVYPVTYTVTYDTENKSYVAFSKLIVIVEG